MFVSVMAINCHYLTRMAQIKQVIELPAEEFQLLKETSQKILTALQNLNLAPQPEYLTAQEFMDQCKIGRWKFDLIKSTGKLPCKQIGRKYYVPRAAVQAYFNGEYTLDD